MLPHQVGAPGDVTGSRWSFASFAGSSGSRGRARLSAAHPGARRSTCGWRQKIKRPHREHRPRRAMPKTGSVRARMSSMPLVPGGSFGNADTLGWSGAPRLRGWAGIPWQGGHSLVLAPSDAQGAGERGKASCRLPNAPCLFHGVMPAQGDLPFNLARGWGPHFTLPPTDPLRSPSAKPRQGRALPAHEVSFKKKNKGAKTHPSEVFFVWFLIFYLLCAHGWVMLSGLKSLTRSFKLHTSSAHEAERFLAPAYATKHWNFP